MVFAAYVDGYKSEQDTNTQIVIKNHKNNILIKTIEYFPLISLLPSVVSPFFLNATCINNFKIQFQLKLI